MLVVVTGKFKGTKSVRVQNIQPAHSK